MMQLSFAEFDRYTQEEREKWRMWFSVHPQAMEIERGMTIAAVRRSASQK